MREQKHGEAEQVEELQPDIQVRQRCHRSHLSQLNGSTFLGRQRATQSGGRRMSSLRASATAWMMCRFAKERMAEGTLEQ